MRSRTARDTSAGAASADRKHDRLRIRAGDTIQGWTIHVPLRAGPYRRTPSDDGRRSDETLP